MQQEQFVFSSNVEIQQYVGPYRLEKTLGKGQTGKILLNNNNKNHFIPVLHKYYESIDLLNVMYYQLKEG